MASKQTSGDHFNGNGSNTAVYITQSNNSKQAQEDLMQLAETCFKSNVPLTLFASLKIQKNIPEKLISEGKVKILHSDEFGDDIKNVCPMSLPLSNDVTPITKWILAANKHFNGTHVLAANGKFADKSSIAEKYFGYWANFWPKLFIGASTNLSSCELLLISVRDFKHICIEKGITDSWQIAALAEKNDRLTKYGFEYGKGNFVFGDGFKSLLKGKMGGFKALFNSFIKNPTFGNIDNKWTNINASIYKKTFAALAAILLLLMCWISFDYNITWDEPNHNTFAKDVKSYYSSLGNDTTMFDFEKAGHRDYVSNVYYGMSIDVAAVFVNDIFDIKNEYATRHFLNALVGFFAILFTALIVRLFTGWLPALITLLAMLCSPSFFGHCFNNPKDIPFAAGYIMALYYLLKLIKELPDAKHQTKVMLAIAIGFAISIRAGGLLLFGYLGLAFVIHLFILNKKSINQKSLKTYFIHFLVVAVAGYFIGILMWPFALRQPLTGAYKALKEFEKFGFLTYYELFEGTRQYIKPWYYEPKLIMLTAPLAVVGGAFIGLLLGWFRKTGTTKTMFFILFFATLFPTSYAIYKQSYVYNGWRHFIFIYPSLVAIAILGWYWLMSLIPAEKVKTGLMILIAVTFVKPGWWSIANHPYQYMYFNEIAGGLKGANGYYETDYWNQTPREAFAWLIKNKPEVLNGKHKVSSNNIQESLKAFNPDGDSVKYAWTREYEWTDNDWKYAIWTTRTLSKSQIIGGYWPPKGTIHEVKVDGITIAAVVQSPNNYSHLGRNYLKKNNADSALYYYTKCYEYNPLEEEFVRGIADACKLKGKYDSAIIFYNKAIVLRDGNYEAYQSLGEVIMNQAILANQENPDMKKIEEAYENFALAYKHKKNSSAPLYMGEIRLMQKRYQEAKDNYHIFMQTYPNVGAGYLGLAKIQLTENETDSALYNLQAAIQLDPNNPQAYGILSDELRKMGRTKEAEQILTEYTKRNGAGAAR